MNLDSYTCTCFPKPRPAIDWDAHLKRQAELRDEICTLKAALSSAPQGWRDIKDAPKDGTKILGVSIWDKGFAQVVYWRKYFDGSEGWACKSGDEVRVDFWTPYTMPLPAAPATKSPADGGGA